MKKYINLKNILFLGLIIVFAVTRLWKLASLPYGLHVDEAAMAYDARCLAEYGYDRHLKSWPLYLSNFGTGQSSLYAFLCVPFIKIFGYSVFIIRMPAVIGSVLNFLYGMRIVSLVFKDKWIYMLATGALITISPYFIMASRFGLDCNLMLGFSTVFLYYLMQAFRTGSYKNYIITGLTGGLMLYSYALSYLVLLLFLVLIWGYSLLCKRFKIKKWLAMAAPMGVLAFPLIVIQIINMFDLPEMKLGIFTLTKLEGYRASEIGRVTLDGVWNVIRSVFVGDDLAYNSSSNYYNCYAITIFFAIVGIIHMIRKFVKSIMNQNYKAEIIIFIWFWTIILVESCVKDVNTNKVNGIFFAYIFLALQGIYYILEAFKKQCKKYVLGGILVAYIILFLDFAHFYFGRNYHEITYPLPYFMVTVEEATDFIEQDEVLKQKVTYMAQTGIYHALGNFENPKNFNIRGNASEEWNNYYFGALGFISLEYNYIVNDYFVDYMQELQNLGFEENKYDGYSLFYQK